MTEQEAIKDIRENVQPSVGGISLEMAIQALEEVEKLRVENNALKNRCYILTRGTLCLFCPMDCSDRKEMFRGQKDD